jgi:hypothetical protein
VVAPPPNFIPNTSSIIDFPTGVLIWHIATNMCYYYRGENASSDEAKKHVLVNRKLSNYVMYLVFVGIIGPSP